MQQNKEVRLDNETQKRNFTKNAVGNLPLILKYIFHEKTLYAVDSKHHNNKI
jgi:hypothetical protein